MRELIDGVVEVDALHERLDQRGGLRPDDVRGEEAPGGGIGDELDEAGRVFRRPAERGAA